MDNPLKRVRTDSTAKAPSDKAKSPMAVARDSITETVASLQPELATVLSRLAVETLVALHRHTAKKTQEERFTANVEWIPKSARNSFGLQGSKLVEQDEEYLQLVSRSKTLVEDFRKGARECVYETTKLEVKKLEQAMSDTFARNLRMAIKACLTCTSSKDARKVDLDKFSHTFLRVYGTKLIVHLGGTLDTFLATFKRVHTLSALPEPFLTSLPTDNAPGLRAVDGSITLPPSWLLELLPVLWRTFEQLFVTPFSKYLDTVQRAKAKLELQKLNEEFFGQKLTDDTAMAVDSEAPVDPKVMKKLIAEEVASKTKELTAQVASLKKALYDKSKNVSWDLPGARTNKLGGRGRQAGEKPKDSKKGRKQDTPLKSSLRKPSPRRSPRSGRKARK